MKNKNNLQCCNNYNQKIIFLSEDYDWKMCEKCDLIYRLTKNKKIEKYKETQFDDFDEIQDSGKFEFLSLLNKLKKYTDLSTLTFLDFGCADGSYLKIAEKYFQKVQGMEPNPSLKTKAKNKNLDILDDEFLNNNENYYNVIFTRNTFEYVSSFSDTLEKLMNKLKKNGYFVWRDKFYDYFPKSYSRNDFPSGNPQKIAESLPTKNAIKYHLSKNQIEVLESRFYFDKSFLIIGQKKEYTKIFKKNFNFNSIFYDNYTMCNIIFSFTKKIHKLYKLMRSWIKR